MADTSLAGPALHLAARVENRFVGWRSARARATGFVPLVIPYTGYGGGGWIRVLGRVLLNKGTHRLTGEPAGARGWRSFMSVPVQHARVEVEVGGVTNEMTADRSGLLDGVVHVDLDPGWHRVEFRVESSEPSYGLVFVIDPKTRFGLVSDIDDTVMMTALPRPLLAAWHTFVVNEHARTTPPGMPVLYERITDAHDGGPVLYLSTGAWNVAPTLTRFLSRNLYPPGTLLLTDWGPTADRLFRSGQEHKRTSLARLAREFPDIKWLLVGDDGQHDEAIYTEFSTDNPGHVGAVCIRQLTPGEAVFAGSSMKDHPRNPDVPWFYAADGAGFVEELGGLRLIRTELQQPEVEA